MGLLKSLRFAAVALLAGMLGCGGSSGSGGGVTVTQRVPVIGAIAPATASVGTWDLSITVYGSNFDSNAGVLWNGNNLMTYPAPTGELSAIIPAADLAAVGSGQITVQNADTSMSAPKTFTVTPKPTAVNFVRAVNIADAQGMVWDATHRKLYVSMPASDAQSPNTIIPIDPYAGTAGTPAPVGNNPDLLSISSDASYLWVSLDGDNAVQRLHLPDLSKDILIPVPTDPTFGAQQAISLEAAPVSAHAVAIVAGNPGLSPTGNGVYVYDDAQRRSATVGNRQGTEAQIDWVQWGADDSTLFGDSLLGYGDAILNANSAGVTLRTTAGSWAGPVGRTQYDPANGNLYSSGYAYNALNGAYLGIYGVPVGHRACTVDYNLQRYYCMLAYSPDGTDVDQFELWVFDLNRYSLIDRLFFGTSASAIPSSLTGGVEQIVRWGNAGLAVRTGTDYYDGAGGIFLIDGPAVNPAAAPDVTAGTGVVAYSSVMSISPTQANAGAGDTSIVIRGDQFTAASTACVNHNYIDGGCLQTTYVTPQELHATIPGALLASPGVLRISVSDEGTDLISTNALTFSVLAPPSGGGSQPITTVPLAGLAMAWDAHSALLYVGTAGWESQYPNSIVAIDPVTGMVKTTQAVDSDPDTVSVSADGQFLYAGFLQSTTLAQVPLPGLQNPVSWPLKQPGPSMSYWAGDVEPAPQDGHTAAATLLNQYSQPPETGGLVLYKDGVALANTEQGWPVNQFDSVAWSATDNLLVAAENEGQLDQIRTDSSGVTSNTKSGVSLHSVVIHSDYGTGLIYGDDGEVVDPTTMKVVGNYNASGLVVPDSSTNHVFIVGQTPDQQNTNDFTIACFDQKAYTQLGTVQLQNLVGSPLQMARWGSAGIALLTADIGGNGSQGMLYLLQSYSCGGAGSSTAALKADVRQRWKRVVRADLLRGAQPKP